ncbi:MAG TPA: hypothetical protein PKM50_06170 [Methanoregula sp.]|nr:hypothetical protein [Methanoregula sp.]
MELQEMLDRILKGADCLGTLSFPEMLMFAASRQINAIAVLKDGNREYYLAIQNGEPEGAIYIDAGGALFGDDAVVRMQTDGDYVICETKPDIIDALVMGCRIFEKGRIRKSVSSTVPEIGVKSQGVGIVSLIVRRDKIPLNGVRVSLRKDGKIVGSDITTGNGEVSFRVMHGTYTCIVQDRTLSVRRFEIPFDESHQSHILDL